MAKAAAKPEADETADDLAKGHPILAFVDAVVTLLTSTRYPLGPKAVEDLKVAAQALKEEFGAEAEPKA